MQKHDPQTLIIGVKHALDTMLPLLSRAAEGLDKAIAVSEIGSTNRAKALFVSCMSHTLDGVTEAFNEILQEYIRLRKEIDPQVEIESELEAMAELLSVKREEAN